jgi:hypothetical protein
MLKIQVRTKLISVFILSLIFLFVIGSGEIWGGEVSAKRCHRAYRQCMLRYGGYLPPPHNLHALYYCGTGLAFCLLYM